ncbi:hypothetical protein EJ06DRAFT_528046 [Trichodelitschia bisporula]|uniref:Uncharacterized protein n=1 Tax=Trichodelitschia bisporula TaxID=703511 RepID=A0A6G1I4H1_9PEZI|nr:hypothetical protein EJ06DRAFT_528046 [Trichodelitschia bisporula]
MAYAEVGEGRVGFLGLVRPCEVYDRVVMLMCGLRVEPLKEEEPLRGEEPPTGVCAAVEDG